MVDTDPRRVLSETIYPEPSFHELLALCQCYGLVTGCESTSRGIQMAVASQVFSLSISQAELLMQGLLLGYFFSQTGDDLSQASWEY